MCNYEDEILLYAYGETAALSAGAKQHLSQCAQCRAVISSAKMLDANLKSHYPNPSNIEAVRSKVIKKPFRILPRVFSFVPLRYAASCALVLIIMFFVYTAGNGPAVQNGSLALSYSLSETEEESEIDTLLTDLDDIAQAHYAENYISVVEPE